MSNKRKYYHYKSVLSEGILGFKKLLVNSKHHKWRGEECNLNLKHKLLIDVSKMGLVDEFRYREDSLVIALKCSSTLYNYYYYYFDNMSDALLFKIKYPEINFLTKLPRKKT